jgi:hypothetical protein
MQRLTRCYITDIASDAAQQRIVFFTKDRLAEPEFHCLHCHSLRSQNRMPKLRQLG